MDKIIKDYTKIYRYSRSLAFDRDKKIIEICKGKNVLHIGAGDAPYTEEKFINGTLLHKKLNNSCNKILGIELDKDSIEYLRKQGVNNIMHLDLNNAGDNFDIGFEVDIIVFGETIEHIMNLKYFFDTIKKIMNDKTVLLISTPNHSYIVITLLSILGIEMTHYDHNLLFSFGTLKQLIEKNDLKLVGYYFTFISRENNSLVFRFLHRISKYIAFLLPWLGETLLFLCIKE